MVSWTCPYCGKSMHSAWDKRTDEAVVCISCDGTFKNPSRLAKRTGGGVKNDAKKLFKMPGVREKSYPNKSELPI